MYKESLEAPEKFWGQIAEDFYWKKKWEAPFHRWVCCQAQAFLQRKQSDCLGNQEECVS